MERVVIIHCHIFKNTGATFDWSLKRIYGEDFFIHRDDKKMEEGAEYLREFLCKYMHIKALSSHHIRFPLPEIPNTKLLPAFILRHPIDRVGSIYLFEGKKDAQTRETITAKNMSFQEYVLWRMKSEGEEIIKNFQTRYCLEKQPEVISEKDFKIAQKRIEETSLLGVADYYDESMVLFEEALRPYYPNIDLSYIKEKVTREGEKGLEHRINTIFNALPLKAIDMLYINNYWDLKLYLEAKSIITNRIANTPNFTSKLNDFYRRCLALKS